MIKLHNSRSNHLEPLHLANRNKVTVYSCGPTVYDHVHVGNLSAFIMVDTLRRTLELTGHKIKHVMNITDIDDKTVARSRQEYPNAENTKKALQDLTEKYKQTFMEDMAAIGNDTSSLTFIKATDSIKEMQALIKNLLDQNFAYIADDGIYFSIAAYKKSGKKYGQLVNITKPSTGRARIDNDEYDKESAHDFALWKSAKDNEPAWEFEIDGKNIKGRPGWHIECSSMSTHALGQPFDIHTGGVDLKFPHHENEIAQSTAGKQDSTYARFFVHNEHILANGKKMAKSANNFYTLEDIRNKGFDPLAFRLLILQSHYRSQAHFSWENMEAASNRLQNYRAFADLLWQLPATSSNSTDYLSEAKQQIIKAMENDLDTPSALAILSKTESEWLRLLSTTNKTKFKEFLQFLDKTFALNLVSTQNITNEQYGLIEERDKARRDKEWAKSDELRDKLKRQNIGLLDTPNGAVWRREP